MNSFNQLKKVKTLLVDDDKQIRDSHSMAFATKGCFLKVAENAEDGLKVLEEEKFDIVISDFRLPGMTGLGFFKLAKIFQPNTLSILITAYVDNDISLKAFELGVNKIIEKPFSVDTLAKSLALLIKNNKAKTASR